VIDFPFGKWPNFQACKTDMMGPPNNYDEETAEKTCGKLQTRLEGKEAFKLLKSVGNRRVIAQYIHVENVDLMKDIIPMRRMKEALEDLKSWDPRYLNVNWRHTSWQIGHPLWSFTDANGTIHKTEIDEYGFWGITEIRNDGYKMADKVWNQILVGEPIGASVAIDFTEDAIKLTKDEVVKRGLPKQWEGANYYDIPLSFIEPWSETPTPANQYVTAAQVLAKEICEPCVKARAKWYLEKGICNNITEALARARHFFIRYNEKESKLKAMTWEQCIEEAQNNPNVDDPEALCGWLKAHGPNAPKKEYQLFSLEEKEEMLSLVKSFK